MTFFLFLQEIIKKDFFLAFIQCSGPSMEPTIVNEDIVFSERMSRHLCKIQK